MSKKMKKYYVWSDFELCVSEMLELVFITFKKFKIKLNHLDGQGCFKGALH